MTRCTPAPACVAALEEATRLWPTRRRLISEGGSDGICASPKHTRQNPGSDHEPHVRISGRSYATAFDLTDDKRNGCDADALVEQLRRRRDPRVKYVIAERRMFSSYPARGVPAWTWRPYTGSNPHTSHVHVSIRPTTDAVFDTSAWWIAPDDQEAPDLQPDERQWLGTIHHHFAGKAKEGALIPILLDKVAKLEQRVSALEREGR